MSMNPRAVLLALQCVFTFYASYAQTLHVLQIDSGKNLQYLRNKKNDENLDPDREYFPTHYFPGKAHNMENGFQRSMNTISGESSEAGKEFQEGRGSSSGDRKLMQSMSSVSWRLRRQRKRREMNPGFDLDYTPPRTHPPVNNR